MQWMLVCSDFYYFVNMFIKLALLTMYLQLTTNKAWHYLIYFMQAGSVIFAMGLAIAGIAEYGPLIHGKAPALYIGKIGLCNYVNSSIMIGFDVCMYAIPLVLTRNIQVSRARKLGLRVLFGLGFM